MTPNFSDLSADDVIQMFDLSPHPEGGFFRETFRDTPGEDGRASSTAIYFLLRESEISRWHRLDCAEVWHWYGGGSITLSIAQTGDATPIDAQLGGNLHIGERPQIIVPAYSWQRAAATGCWTLAGCTVAPGFEFDMFEIAPDNWSPGSGAP